MYRQSILSVMMGLLLLIVGREAMAAETHWIPMLDDVTGEPIQLEATLYRPSGEGPFPLMVFNHGSTGNGMMPASMTEQPWGYGAYLNQRGIALLVPMRRGRGKSGGDYREDYRCDQTAVDSGIAYAMVSLDAVADWIAAQDWVRQDRVMLSGQSRGGLLSLLYAARHPQQIKGVINFVGGWSGSACADYQQHNTRLFAKAGNSAAAPALFFYADNDPFYPLSASTAATDQYRAAGGEAELKVLEPGADHNGHLIFYSHWQQWTPITDRYLAERGMVPH